mmetsp:Transcript_16535/g.25227  ORF Transcript_16535/g.25227 Transcript_16535/m.25227 type:complete len:108 (+) Transcript_16535:156-479(+)
MVGSLDAATTCHVTENSLKKCKKQQEAAPVASSHQYTALRRPIHFVHFLDIYPRRFFLPGRIVVEPLLFHKKFDLLRELSPVDIGVDLFQCLVSEKRETEISQAFFL